MNTTWSVFYLIYPVEVCNCSDCVLDTEPTSHFYTWKMSNMNSALSNIHHDLIDWNALVVDHISAAGSITWWKACREAECSGTLMHVAATSRLSTTNCNLYWRNSSYTTSRNTFLVDSSVWWLCQSNHGDYWSTSWSFRHDLSFSRFSLWLN